MVTAVARLGAGFTTLQLYNQDVGNCSQVILVSIKEFCVAGRKSLVSMNKNILARCA